MSDTNQQTLAAYNDAVQAYIDGSPKVASGGIKGWIDESLAGLPKEAKILEIGSANGRDANYIEAKGYKVDCTDASQGFVDYLNSNGRSARLLNLITDNLVSDYDLVFADAVLLHFTRDELEQSVKKVFAALALGGRFAFTLKEGEGEELTDRKLAKTRYFCYWQAKQIKTVLEQTGFSDISIDNIGDYRGSDHNGWLLIIAKKAAP